MTLILKQLSIVFVLLFKNRRRREMKKNNSLLVIGIVSISLLLILSVIQSSTAQRDDDDDHHHDHGNFELTVRLISDEERHIPDYKVKVSGETKSIDGEEFEDDGKANVKFYLNDVDNKEKVCITNERNDNETCKKFNTDGDEVTVKFDIG